jgi:protein-S-isoprenylcysteine O-methyltransferase Ste14
LVLGYLAVALLCLRRWGAPAPWSRLDAASALALLASVVLAVQQVAFGRALPQTAEVQREAFGMSYDPAMARAISLLAAVELLVFVEYAHEPLAQALDAGALRWSGVVLYAATVAWLAWVDAALVGHFNEAASGRRLLTTGPYRYVRHPRYVGLIASRVAFALVFASVVAWVLIAGWVWIVRRRVVREEAHLTVVFGPAYGEYAQRTWRLVPGLY